MMLAPLIGIDGKIHYVNPTLIRCMSPGPDMEELAPDGNPWPSTIIWFSEVDKLEAKGSAPMILQSWFGAPANREEERRVVVPPAYVRVPKGKIQ